MYLLPTYNNIVMVVQLLTFFNCYERIFSRDILNRISCRSKGLTTCKYLLQCFGPPFLLTNLYIIDYIYKFF